MSIQFKTPPPTPEYAHLTIPAPHVLLVTLNRPRQLNCINAQGHAELARVWEWMDEEPSIRVGILTGRGRGFCAGADLKEWNNNTNNTTNNKTQSPTPTTGFGAFSRRKGRKPILCAVNGVCLGGGTEMLINGDMVIASSGATIGLPEVKRGVVALAGALPRLIRTVGRQRAMEMVLTGRSLTAREAERWGLVNFVVSVDDLENEDLGQGKENEGGKNMGKEEKEEEICRRVVEKAVAVASEIAANSPDAVLVSREGVKLGWEGVGADEATTMLGETWVRRLYEGENMKEGLRAFVEKREPVWVDSKL